VIEPSGLLWDLHKELTHGHESYQEVFAVVEGREVSSPSEGFGADYHAAIQIEKVLYVGIEGPGCNEDWTSYHYRAYGNEPFWSVKASDRRILLSRLGSDDLLWQDITSEQTGEGFRYTAIDSAMPPVELTITGEPCRDSMSGAYYAFTAVLCVGDEELHGCAFQGTALPYDD
jgi:putative lipoprotein